MRDYHSFGLVLLVALASAPACSVRQGSVAHDILTDGRAADGRGEVGTTDHTGEDKRGTTDSGALDQHSWDVAVDLAADLPLADLPATDYVAVDAPMSDLAEDTNAQDASDSSQDSKEIDVSGEDVAKDVVDAGNVDAPADGVGDLGDLDTGPGDSQSDLPQSACGDGTCDLEETCDTCPGDCNPCYAPLYGACEPGVAQCDPDLHICVAFGEGALGTFCMPKCVPEVSDCPGGKQCIALGAGIGYCPVNGTAQQDQLCDASDTPPPPNQLDSYCAEGLLCVVTTTPAAQGVCMPLVDFCEPNACEAGRLCLGITGGEGVCALDCASTPCPGGTTCQQLTSGQSICGVAPPPGTVPFGHICELGSVEKACELGLVCVAANAASLDGFCSSDCTGVGTCPTYLNTEGIPIPTTCLQVSASQSLCLFTCGAPGQICPEGLNCTLLPGGPGICLL